MIFIDRKTPSSAGNVNATPCPNAADDLPSIIHIPPLSSPLRLSSRPSQPHVIPASNSHKTPQSRSSSISLQIFSIRSLFFLAFSRFCAVLTSRSALRHLLTSVLALLHPPSTLWRKPCAWHSSRRAITSSQPGDFSLIAVILGRRRGALMYLYCPLCGDGDAWLVLVC